jgi:hypothetical protein
MPDALIRTKRISLLIAGLALVAAPLALWSWRNAVPIPLLSGAGVAFLFAFNRWWRKKRGRVRADENGLWLDGSCLAPRASIRAADMHQHAVTLRRNSSRRFVS